MKFLKGVGRALVGAMVFNALSPLAVLAQDQGSASVAAQSRLRQAAAMQQRLERERFDQHASSAERVARDFGQAQDLVRSLKLDQQDRRTAAGSSGGENELRAIGPDMRIEARRSATPLSDERRDDARTRLTGRLKAIREGQADVLAEFARTGRELESRALPAEIRTRQDEAAAQVARRVAEFESLTQAWLNDQSDQNLAGLADFFKRYPAKKIAPAAPARLPWSAPTPTTREPAVTRTAWFQQLWGDQRVTLAQAGGGGPISFEVAPEPGQAPQAADLAESPETRRTDAILAKAQELGGNPVAIHNWVRNTIEFVPTWGAVQSAEETLFKRRGNAHDTAGLEIALLRAAGIPARYQYGTIEMGAEQVQNWVGGVTVPQAAQQLLGQGGIANKGLVSAGKITRIQFEHVWVQAYVNWVPSRGGKQGSPTQHVNPNGRLNAWVALDPSFKQYQYSAGLDLNAAVPMDAAQLMAVGRQGATANDAEGWIQNVNQVGVNAFLADHQTRVHAYLTAQSASDTLGGMIGKKVIPADQPSTLSGSLPYAVVHQGSRVAAVPPALQHRFTYRLYASREDRDGDNPLLSFTDSTSNLVGRRLTLSYAPASQADRDLIASYLPKPHADGSPIQPSEFPTSLPGYLIRLKAQITLDGQVVATSSQSLPMGTDLYSVGGFSQLHDPTTWDLTGEESNVVGNVTAIGIDAHGVSSATLAGFGARLAQTRARIESSNLEGLTGEGLSGDLLGGILMSWFAAAQGHNQMAQNAAGMVENPGLSYGLLHAVANPIYSWGVIRRVTFPGMNMDIGHVRTLGWSKANLARDWVAYNRMRGHHMSGLEHQVPERFFSNKGQCNQPDQAPVPELPNCPQGISAVKAIALAAQAGQRIYAITQKVYADNPSIVSTQLAGHSVDTQSRIRNYLDVGYEVNIHQFPITQGGWTGAGFIATDPSTGAGAYLIEGGSNGAWIPVDSIGAAMLIMVLGPLLGALAAGVSLFAAVILIASVLWGLTQYIAYVDAVIDRKDQTPEQKRLTIQALSILAAVSGLISYWKAGGDAAAAGLGILLASLTTIFKKVEEYLRSLFG